MVPVYNVAAFAVRKVPAHNVRKVPEHFLDTQLM